MGINTSAVQRLYIAYFNRPADPAGLATWEGQLPATAATQAELTALAAGFSGSQEYINMYSGLVPVQIINLLYLNLFGREAEPAGLIYWADRLQSGAETFAGIALQLTYSAQGSDAVAIASKLAAATAFTSGLDTTAEITGYNGYDAAASARDWLADVKDAASLATAIAPQALAAAITNATTADDGLLAGQTIVLTDTIDDVEITTPNTLDVVKGIFDDGGDDTLSAGDAIKGNGYTRFDLTVTDGGLLDYADITGVKTLNVRDTSAVDNMTIDATSLDDELSEINLSGKDAAYLYVCNYANTELDVSVAADSDSTLYVSGTLDGACLSVSLQNDDANEIGTSVSIGSSGIHVVAGEADYYCLALCNTSSDDTGLVEVGGINTGDINVTATGDCYGSICISNCAYNTNTGGSGDAHAGAITIGNINLYIDENAYLYLYACNMAYAITGDATADGISVGDITTSLGKDASQSYWNFAASATVADDGNATVGDINIGNISINATESDYPIYTYICQYAEAGGGAGDDGNATVGNLTIGDFTLNAKTDVTWGALCAYQTACVSGSGDANVGDTSIGNINVNVEGNTSEIFTLDMYFGGCAYVATSGNASIGDTTIGNINFAAENSACFDLCVDQNVTAVTTASIGDMIIGDIDVNMGISSCFDITVDQCVTGATTTESQLGTFTVGDMNVVGESDSVYSFSLDRTACYGHVGDSTVGDININMGEDSSVSISLGFYGCSIGDVSVGDISISLGESATLCYLTASLCASEDIGHVSIGDVSLTVGESGGIEIDDFVEICSTNGDVASIEVGNIDVHVGESGYGCMYHYVYLSNGDVGSSSIGDVNIDVESDANFYYCNELYASGDLGEYQFGNQTLNVTGEDSCGYFVNYVCVTDDMESVEIGDINVSVSGDNISACLSNCFENSGGDIGDVNIGNMSVIATATDDGVCAYNYLYVCGGGDDVGDINIGDITISAIGQSATAYMYITAEADTDTELGSITIGDVEIYAEGQSADACLTISASSANDMGEITIGDISISLANTADATSTATGCMYLCNVTNIDVGQGGQITIGNIDLNAADVTDDYLDSACVCAYVCITGNADVNVGDITVVGGYVNGNDTLMDNFDSLTSWLDISACGDINVGDIDYSDYEASATIDVSSFDSVGIITAAQKDTVIVDNGGQNFIYLGDGLDTVCLVDDQSTSYATGLDLDIIYNFNSDDDIIETSGSGTDESVSSTSLANYAAFVTAANNADTDIFARKLVGGDDWYVAVDQDGDDTIDFAFIIADPSGGNLTSANFGEY